MSEDLMIGIRNALERGHPLDKVLLSFINAGYSPQEVEEAARYFSSDVSGILSSSQHPSGSSPSQQQYSQHAQNLPSQEIKSPAAPFQKQNSTPIVNQIKEPAIPPKYSYSQSTFQAPLAAPYLAAPKPAQLFQQSQISSLSNPYYPQQKPASSKGTITILVILLFILIGLLTGLIIYREKIAGILAA